LEEFDDHDITYTGMAFVASTSTRSTSSCVSITPEIRCSSPDAHRHRNPLIGPVPNENKSAPRSAVRFESIIVVRAGDTRINRDNTLRRRAALLIRSNTSTLRQRQGPMVSTIPAMPATSKSLQHRHHGNNQHHVEQQGE